MALVRTDMNLIGSGGFGKVWSYITVDAHAAVIAANYFNPMAAQLSINDRIHLKDATGIYDLAVSANNGTTVTVVSSVAYA
jgi:predicted secreted protein